MVLNKTGEQQGEHFVWNINYQKKNCFPFVFLVLSEIKRTIPSNINKVMDYDIELTLTFGEFNEHLDLWAAEEEITSTWIEENYYNYWTLTIKSYITLDNNEVIVFETKKSNSDIIEALDYHLIFIEENCYVYQGFNELGNCLKRVISPMLEMLENVHSNSIEDFENDPHLKTLAEWIFLEFFYNDEYNKEILTSGFEILADDSINLLNEVTELIHAVAIICNLQDEQIEQVYKYWITMGSE